MSQAKLSERHQNILRTTIQHYIATAEPVGSKTLAEEYGFRVSSATIRNVLGRLEKAGLLYQPHTSAGRIPSDWGYRTYVDKLLTPNEVLERKIEKSLTQQLEQEASWSLEALIRRAAQILATLSGYIALITLPQNPTNQVRHLQLIQVDSNQVMLIVVTDSYETQSILMEFPLPLTEAELANEQLIERELQILSNFLNHKLQGKKLSELTLLDWSELDQEFQHYTDLIKGLLQELNRRIQPSSSTPIMIRGISEVLRQPEFSELQQVQMLLHLLEEEQDQLLPLILEFPALDLESKRVSIRIGSENALEPLNSCTLISSLYCQGDVPVGSVGIIGPTRMLYENTIMLVASTADYLSDMLG